MTDKKRYFRKKFAIILSVFLALVAGFSTSAVLLNKKHEQKVTAAIPEKRYTGDKIIESDEEITSDDIGVGNVKLTEVASSVRDESESSKTENRTKKDSTNNQKKHVYLVNYSDVNKKDKKSIDKYFNKNASDVVEEDVIFQTAEINGPDQTKDVEKASSDTDLNGKTLREYADSQKKKLVAVIDTGVNDGYAIQSVNFSSSPMAEDKNGHGTKVAKEILDSSNNQAVVVSLKAMDDDGTGSMFNVMKAVQYAIDQHVDIINMSITAADNGRTSIFKDVINNAMNQGITVVAAAGNYGLEASHFIPANITGVITAGAINEDGEVASFSNYGTNNEVYVKNASSTSLATAQVTGTIAAKGKDGLKNNDNVTSDYHLSTLQKAESLFAGKDIDKFIVQDYPANERYLMVIDPNGGFVYDTGQSDARFHHSGYPDDPLDPIQTQNFLISSIDHQQRNTSDFAYGFLTYGTSSYEQTIGANVLKRKGYLYNGLWSGPNRTDEINDEHAHAEEVYIPYENPTGTSKGIARDTYWTMGEDGHLKYCHRWQEPTGNPYEDHSADGHTRVRFFAQWKPLKYKIDFDANGGAGTMNTEEFTYDTPQNLTANVYTRDDYIFTGWKDDYGNTYSDRQTITNLEVGPLDTHYYRQESKQIESSDPNHPTYVQQDVKGITLHAQWKPIVHTVYYNGGTLPHSQNNVTFNKAGGGTVSNSIGNVPGAQTVQVNSGITPPSNATASGYNFVGWFDGDGNPVRNITMPDHDITLYAHWEQKQHSISINSVVNNGATDGSHMSYTISTRYNDSNNAYRYDHTAGSDDLVTINVTPEAGYTFGGTSPNDGTKFVTSRNNDGGGEAGNPSGNSVTIRVPHNDQDPTVTVYLYGWTYHVNFNNNSAYGSIFTDGTHTPNDPRVHLATGSTAGQSFTYGKNGQLNANGYSWPGLTFKGWSVKNPATSANYGNQATSTYFGNPGYAAPTNNDTTVQLYAVWERNSVQVRVYPNGGSWNGSTAGGQKPDNINRWGDHQAIGKATPPNKQVTVSYDSQGGTPENPTTARYEFDHWTICDTSNNEVKDTRHGFFANGTESVTGNSTNDFYAADQPTNLVANYYYSKIILPTPTKAGYSFVGWYYEPDYIHLAGKGGEEYRAPQNSNTNIQLYARWVPDNFSPEDLIDLRMENVNSPDNQSPVYKIGKFDSNGNPLTGAIITVYEGNTAVLRLDTSRGLMDGNGNMITVNRDGNGFYQFSGHLIAGHSYRAVEEQAPQGYFFSDEYDFTVQSGQNVTIKMTDPKITSFLNFVKCSGAHPSTELQGAEFDVYDNDKKVTSAHTDKDGNLVLNNGDPKQNVTDYFWAGHTIKLVETKAPLNYEKKTFTFQVPKTPAGMKNFPATFFYNPDREEAELRDAPIMINLAIQKMETYKDRTVNAKTGNSTKTGERKERPLAGSEFQLYVMKKGKLYPAVHDENGNLLDPFNDAAEYQANKNNTYIAVSGRDGIAKFPTKLPPKALASGTDEDTKQYDIPELAKKDGAYQKGTQCDWYIVETKTTKGHSLLPYPVKITIRDDVANNDTVTFKLTNNEVIEVLNAGGHGNLMYIFTGAAIILVGIAYAMKRRKAVQNG